MQREREKIYNSKDNKQKGLVTVMELRSIKDTNIRTLKNKNTKRNKLKSQNIFYEAGEED